MDVLEFARPGTILLINTPYEPNETFAHLPEPMQRKIIDLGIELWAIDANLVARKAGMGKRTNTVLQTCFFAISKVMPREEAIEEVKRTIRKTYARKGADVVLKNEAAVDASVETPAPRPRPRGDRRRDRHDPAGAGRRARVRAQRDRLHAPRHRRPACR